MQTASKLAEKLLDFADRSEGDDRTCLRLAAGVLCKTARLQRVKELEAACASARAELANANKEHTIINGGIFAQIDAALSEPSDQLDRYDAGLLAGEGMPNFEWWWDSIRFHLDRAHEFYQSQAAALSEPSVQQAAAIDDDHFEYDAKPGTVSMRQCISGFGHNAIEDITDHIADSLAGERPSKDTIGCVAWHINELVRWCRYHNGERQRLRERVRELEGAAKDFVRNCPACGGAGELPDAMTSDGLSPAGLCVWCAKFRTALGQEPQG